MTWQIVLPPALALFDGKRVIGGFEFEEGTLTDGASVEVGLQVQRGRGVSGQLVGQSSEVRRFAFSTRLFPEVECPEEVVLTEGDPDAPGEDVAGSVNWNVDGAANEEPLPP
jgi:hypothetical protein